MKTNEIKKMKPIEILRELKKGKIIKYTSDNFNYIKYFMKDNKIVRFTVYDGNGEYDRMTQKYFKLYEDIEEMPKYYNKIEFLED